MDDRITIIEGPTPLFEAVQGDWVYGLTDSPDTLELAVTRLRTFNGPALVERCHRAWRNQSSIYLHFRDRMGMETRQPIFAARTAETSDGQMLLLWVRKPPQDVLDDADEDFGEDN